MNYPHPLHMAAAIGKSPGVIRELVMMFGVNKLDTSSRTPLMFAALGNNKSSSCATLLRCSAEVDLQDISGLTALHVACYHGNKSAASILLSNKASIATRDKLVSFKKQKKKTHTNFGHFGTSHYDYYKPRLHESSNPDSTRDRLQCERPKLGL